MICECWPVVDDERHLVRLGAEGNPATAWEVSCKRIVTLAATRNATVEFSASVPRVLTPGYSQNLG